MTAERRIRDYLTTYAGRQYCDDCLSSVLQIKPRQQVHQKTSALGNEPLFRRTPGICTRCHSDRIVIEAVAVRPTTLSQVPEDRQRVITPARVVPDPVALTTSERHYCENIRAKDRALRTFLTERSLGDPPEAVQWLSYLVGIKNTLGNINNDVGFAATLMVKRYLEERFAISDFDAAGKPQGASGIDVQARTAEGKTIAGELKTTKPYQPAFGAAQRATILKDLQRLAETVADYRFMFVIDADAFAALGKKPFASQAPGVEVVDLLSGKTFVSQH
jgi:hypothetical protein